jgi:hypothetical protein
LFGNNGTDRSRVGVCLCRFGPCLGAGHDLEPWVEIHHQRRKLSEDRQIALGRCRAIGKLFLQRGLISAAMMHGLQDIIRAPKLRPKRFACSFPIWAITPSTAPLSVRAKARLMSVNESQT